MGHAKINHALEVFSHKNAARTVRTCLHALSSSREPLKFTAYQLVWYNKSSVLNSGLLLDLFCGYFWEVFGSSGWKAGD